MRGLCIRLLRSLTAFYNYILERESRFRSSSPFLYCLRCGFSLRDSRVPICAGTLPLRVGQLSEKYLSGLVPGSRLGSTRSSALVYHRCRINGSSIMISFTRRKIDRSNETGFQFEFCCDRCNTSHMTSFQYNPMGVAASLATAAGHLFRKHRDLGSATREINHLLRGKAWEDAYDAAVIEAKRVFKQCTRCSGWVCPDTCWSAENMMCRDCSPNMAAEAVAAKAEAGKVQMFFNAMDTDQTRGFDVSQNIAATCPYCLVPGQGGKYCADCGKDISANVYCGACGSQWPSLARYKFCPKCGDPMADLFNAPGKQ